MKTITSIKSIVDSKQFLAIVSVTLIALMSLKVSLTQQLVEQSFATNYEFVQK